jgi:hypothetical protein
MAQALKGDRATKADWGRREGGVPPGGCAITRSALQGAIRDGLGDAALAERLPAIGSVFGAAIKLREDSNYESLILAHQYSHGSASQDFVNVQEEFARATELMSAANLLVLQYTVDVLLAAFRPDSEWFCPSISYHASDLLQLVAAYVGDKVRSYYDQWGDPPSSRTNWGEHLGPLSGLVEAASFDAAGDAVTLTRHAQFSTFDMKRGIMRVFRQKIDGLSDSLRPAGSGESAFPLPHQNDH